MRLHEAHSRATDDWIRAQGSEQRLLGYDPRPRLRLGPLPQRLPGMADDEQPLFADDNGA